jgi:hypothetical protein
VLRWSNRLGNRKAGVFTATTAMARTAEHREVARCLHTQETDLRFYRGVRKAEAFTSMHKREVREKPASQCGRYCQR